MPIDHDIPPPPKWTGGARLPYTIDAQQMKPGDSVLCGTPKILNAVIAVLRRKGCKTRWRKGADGWRVWRVDGLEEKPAAKAPPAPKPAEPARGSDAEVTALHGLAIANRAKVSVADARRWVAEGVTEADLRVAIERLRHSGGELSVAAIQQAMGVPA